MSLVLIFIATIVCPSLSSAGSLDPFWMASAALKEKSGAKNISGTDHFDTFIKSRDVSLTSSKIISGGGKTRSIFSDLLVAELPSSLLQAASEWDEVEYIEIAKPLAPTNDLANIDTRVANVHAANSPDVALTGLGTVVGIIDSGIDFGHPAFKDAGGRSRIVSFWDQEGTGGTPPSDLGYDYGTEYKKGDIAAGNISDGDTSGHGTHVAAIAAGRDAAYSGVAPDAQIIFVKYRTISYDELVYSTGTFSTDICDAVSYIYRRAGALGKPAVVNLSLGSSIGPHDGTSLFEQCLEGLVTEKPGRSIVAAAGNSSRFDGGEHASFAVDPSNTHAVTLYPLAMQPLYFAEIWGAPDCDTSLELELWRYIKSNNASSRKYYSKLIARGLTDSGYWQGVGRYIVQNAGTPNVLNSKYNSYVAFYPDSGFNFDTDSFDIKLKGSCSRVDMWSFPSTYAAFGLESGDIANATYHPGDSLNTITVPATASGIISAGAYSTKNSWTDKTGEPEAALELDIGNIAYFSSQGPSLNPKEPVQPVISAPGAFIVSARSSKSSSADVYIIDDLHTAMAGTSMAAPHVAGIVALMFQASPNITGLEAKNIIQNTARMDPYVLSAPNDIWGYGKIDAAAATKAVVSAHPGEIITSVSADGSDGDGSGSASGGCSISSGPFTFGSLFDLALALLFALTLISKSRIIRECKPASRS